MTGIQKVLILGTGPVAVQVAVNLKQYTDCKVAIAGRSSLRSAHFFKSLQHHDGHLSVSVQNENHQAMAGECRLDEVFDEYEKVTGTWDTVILTVTTDAYVHVLRQLNTNILANIRCIILISPTFGSGTLIRDYISTFNSDVEIISFSTYYGDTRWTDPMPSYRVSTTAVKKRIYIGSTLEHSASLAALQKVMIQLGVELKTMSSPLEAETRNISLYVHPALFMNEFSLQVIFGDSTVPKFVYKLYPEGPINQQLIRNMLNQWKEMMQILEKLNIARLNLLQFMVDDNYPVAAESLARADIDQFIHLDSIHQEYLLYVRYASLLIDPFSRPDEEGRYFDFSAVPIRQVFINKEGHKDIPRMPQEDYYRIKMIQGMAQLVHVPCPTIDQFIDNYEFYLRKYAEIHPEEVLSSAFRVQNYQEDLKRIGNVVQTSR